MLQSKSRKLKEAEPEEVCYRGSICFYCHGQLLTNLYGTIVRHRDGSAYKCCVEAMVDAMRKED